MNKTAVKLPKFIKTALISFSMLAGTAVTAIGSDLPTISITPSNSTRPSMLADTAYVTEGSPVGFYLETRLWLDRDITVNVKVEDEGGFLSENYHQTVLPVVIKTFSGVDRRNGVYVHLGRLRKVIDFMTAMDNIPEEDGLITFTLLNGEGYEIDERKKVAKTYVLDNDNNFVPGHEVDVSFVASPDNQTVRGGKVVYIYAVTSKDAILEYRITILKQDGRELVYNRKRRVSRIVGNNRITRWSPSFRRSYLQLDNANHGYYDDLSFSIKITAINGTEVDGEELVLAVGELPRINTTESEGADDPVEEETVAVKTEDTPSEVSEESDTEESESEGTDDQGEEETDVVNTEDVPTEVSEESDTEESESEGTDDQGEEETDVVKTQDVPSEVSEESDTDTSVTDVPETDEEESEVASLPVLSVFADTDTIEPGSNPVFYLVADRLNFKYMMFQYSYELESGVTVPLQYYEEGVPSSFNLRLPRFAGKHAKRLTPYFGYLPNRERIRKYHVDIVELDLYEVNQSYNRATVSIASPDSVEVGKSSSGVSPDSSTTVEADVSPPLPEIDISTNRGSGEPVREGEHVKINFTASAKPTGPVYVRFSAYANAGKEISVDKKKFSPDDFVRQTLLGKEVFVATFVWSTENDADDLSGSMNQTGGLLMKVEMLNDENDPTRSSYTVGENRTVSFNVWLRPEVSISADSEVITEGSDAVFTLTASHSDHKGFKVSFSTELNGDFIANSRVKEVEFDANSVEEKFTIQTSGGKSGEKSQGLEVKLLSGQGYKLDEKSWTASLKVLEKENLSSSTKVQEDVKSFLPVLPTVLVRAERDVVTEGQDAVFLVISDFPLHKKLLVNLAVTTVGDFLLSPLPETVPATILAGKTHGRVVLETVDDKEDEVNDGIVSVRVLSGAGYAVWDNTQYPGKTPLDTAKIKVVDNDSRLSTQYNSISNFHRTLMEILLRSTFYQTRGTLHERFGMAFSDENHSHSLQISSNDDLTSIIEDGGYLLNSNNMRLTDILHDSSFAFPIFPDVNGPSATIWGKLHNLTENGWKDQIAWNGNSFTGQLGIDTRVRNDLLIGATTFSADSKLDLVHEDKDGIYNVDMNTFQPYLAWSDENFQVNGSVGYGFGEIEVSLTDSSESETVDSTVYSASVAGQSSLYDYENGLGKGELIAEGSTWTAMQQIQGYDSISTQGYEVLLNGSNAKSFDNGLSVETSATIGLEERKFNLEAFWDFHADSILISPNYNAEWNDAGIAEQRLGSRVSIGTASNAELGIAIDKEGNRKFELNGQIQW